MGGPRAGAGQGGTSAMLAFVQGGTSGGLGGGGFGGYRSRMPLPTGLGVSPVEKTA